MATTTTETTPRLAALRSAARGLFYGLLWGAIVLFILALWLRTKDADAFPVMPWLIGLVGLGSLGLAVWQAVTLWGQRAAPEAQEAALVGQRRTTGLLLLGGGVALVLLAAFLGLGQRPGDAGFGILWNNFGEAFGLFLFALVTLAAGRALLAPPRTDPAVNLDPLRGIFPLIRVGLFVLFLVAIALFLVLTFHYQLGSEYWPEMAAILLFSTLCLALGLWVITQSGVDSFTLRMFVLIFGGATGLILFLMTLGRAWVWRHELFLGGISAWQGERAWQFWMLVYLQLIALALMFGSLLLARADVRSNVVLRRVLFGYNTLLEGLLLLEMLIVLNVVFYVLVPYTFDWTKTRGLHSLAQSSKNLLHELKEPTEVFVLLAQNNDAYADLHNLLDNMQAETNKLAVTYISPDRDVQQYEKLARLFPKILPSARVAALEDATSGRGVLLVYGAMPEDEKQKVPYAFVPERKILEVTPAMHGRDAGKSTRTFKGEVELTKELNFLVRGQEKRTVYFLQGEDELDFKSTEINARRDPRADMSLIGGGILADKLKKDNYEVKGLSL
jgi:hypothetical protein